MDHQGVTQEELSLDTGISQSSISRYKSGTQEPRITELYLIAKYFGVTLEWLVLEDAPMPPDKLDRPALQGLPDASARGYAAELRRISERMEAELRGRKIEK